MKKNDYLLDIENLSVAVKGKELLKHLTLKIPYGQVHALLGMNGSGKSTLMKTIMGYPNYKVTTGHILFKGIDILPLNITERANLGIGIVDQRPPVIPGVRLKDLMTYIHSKHNNSEAMKSDLISKANMSYFMNRDINKDFSGGEIKRAELMQLLALSPSFSMMDEPDSGVDIESLKHLGDLIQSLLINKSGLIVTHYGNILDYIQIDKAHVMFNGQIGCTGHPKAIIETIKKHGYETCITCTRRELTTYEKE